MCSFRFITKPTDRLAALHGFNKLVGSALDNTSVAGLWSGSYFQRSLVWAADRDTHQVSAVKSEFPSWS